MAITTTSFVPDPREGQMIPRDGSPMNVDANDTVRGPKALAVPAPAMTSGAGQGRVVIKKGR